MTLSDDALADNLRSYSKNTVQVLLPDAAVVGRLAALAGVAPSTDSFGFGWQVCYIILKAYESDALNNAHKFPHKKVARHARELAALLKASNVRHVMYLLSRFGEPLEAQDDLPSKFLYVTGLNPYLVNELIGHLGDISALCRAVGNLLKERRVARDINAKRHEFVGMLLDAVRAAGGRLTLDRRKEGGSLAEAIEILTPYLPEEIAGKLSLSTLRRVYEAWIKRRKHNSKKTSSERTRA